MLVSAASSSGSGQMGQQQVVQFVGQSGQAQSGQGVGQGAVQVVPSKRGFMGQEVGGGQAGQEGEGGHAAPDWTKGLRLGQEAEGWGVCMYDCGPPRPTTQLRRSNAKAKWACYLCYNAARALAASCRSSNMRGALQWLQKKDPVLYAAKVRSCRICEETGISSPSERASAITHLVTTLTQVVGVREVGGKLWLTRNQWIAWHQLWEGQGPEVSGPAWDAEAKNRASGNLMQLKGDALRVGVMDIPKTENYRQREWGRQIRTDHGRLESLAQANQALADVAAVGTGQGVFSRPLFGDMAPTGETGVPEVASIQAPTAESMFPEDHWGARGQRIRSLKAHTSNASSAEGQDGPVLDGPGADERKKKNSAAAGSPRGPVALSSRSARGPR